ncbi:ABC transporter permease subunit [Granulosicoccaceae sp. 1_MG-2023]|nr:ABC transporter permease subunit [Granulosicoccaceae sp. 1_MG-2023]
MIGTIAAQELRLMFRSPLAWVIAAVMQLVFAWLFLSALEQFVTSQAKLASLPDAPGVTAFVIARYVAPAAIIMLLISPLLCMRTLAEEQRSGTLVLLRAAPVSMTHIVLGKFLGIFLLQWAMLSLAFAMPLSLAFFTSPDAGSLFTAWLGISLFAAACTALSLYFSAITRQPLIAAFAAFAALLFLWLLGTGSFSSETASAILHGLSMPRHLNSFFRGLLDTRDLLYFALFITLFLSLAVIKLDSLRYTEAH